MTEDLTPCYLGRKPCGCVVATLVSVPGCAREDAKIIAQWVREGRIIESSTVDEAQKQLKTCRCETLAKAKAWSAGEKT